VLLLVKFFGSTFHILVHLFKYDFWNVVVLHRVVVNDKWSGSDDLVSLWLLTLLYCCYILLICWLRYHHFHHHHIHHRCTSATTITCSPASSPPIIINITMHHKHHYHRYHHHHYHHKVLYLLTFYLKILVFIHFLLEVYYISIFKM
jgi:phosphatidylserine synthase